VSRAGIGAERLCLGLVRTGADILVSSMGAGRMACKRGPDTPTYEALGTDPASAGKGRVG
jgi:hypothetical protein